MLSFYKKTLFELVKSPKRREEEHGFINSSKYIYEILKQQSFEIGIKKKIKKKFKRKFTSNKLSKPNLNNMCELQIISNSTDSNTNSDGSLSDKNIQININSNGSSTSEKKTDVNINLETTKNKIIDV
jgi:hypothetical protein